VVGAICRSQAGRALLLLGSLLVSAAVVVPCAYAAEQHWGVLSAVVAMATCLGGGFLALWLVQLCQGPGSVMPQVLLGMFARMGIPLLVCIIVYLQGGRLAEAGFVYYLLAFYFVTLIVETVLLVGNARPQVTGKPMV
jgi:hypothetical protein